MSFDLVLKNAKPLAAICKILFISWRLLWENVVYEQAIPTELLNSRMKKKKKDRLYPQSYKLLQDNYHLSYNPKPYKTEKPLLFQEPLESFPSSVIHQSCYSPLKENKMSVSPE